MLWSCIVIIIASACDERLTQRENRDKPQTFFHGPSRNQKFFTYLLSSLSRLNLSVVVDSKLIGYLLQTFKCQSKIFPSYEMIQRRSGAKSKGACQRWRCHKKIVCGWLKSCGRAETRYGFVQALGWARRAAWQDLRRGCGQPCMSTGRIFATSPARPCRDAPP
jgi:hypothetical protein